MATSAADVIDEIVTVNGVRLHARVEGAESKPWIAFSNSLATNLEMWDEQIPALRDRYRILRYDTRGHGGSEAPAGPYTMDQLVDDLRALLRHYGARRATVAGVSMGGLIALAAAQRHVPEVGAIAVCDSRADFPPEFAKGMDERNALVREKGIGAIVLPMTGRWLTEDSMAKRPDLVAKIGRMIESTSAEGFIACTYALRTADLLPHLPTISIPSLFVIGDQDAALPVPMMRGMADQVSGASFAEIPKAGHISNLEQPAAFNAVLLRFLEKLA